MVYSPVTNGLVPVSYGEDHYCNTTVVRCPVTKGPMPPEAIDAQGRQIWDRVPDFLAVLDRDGDLAGYGSRYDISCGGDGPFDVLSEDLSEVVGQMVPGVGFEPAN